jgi:hypothetical protein
MARNIVKVGEFKLLSYDHRIQWEFLEILLKKWIQVIKNDA